MLNQQTLQRLRALKLTGMADPFAQQLEQPPTQQLSFEERLALLVDRERTHRDNRRLQRLLRSAHLKQQACVPDQCLALSLEPHYSPGDSMDARRNRLG